MSQWLPFVLFAFVASITPPDQHPGAEQQLALRPAGGASHHLWRLRGRGADRAASGPWRRRMAAAPSAIAAGDGLARVGWLLYLAWQIARSPTEAIEADTASRRLGALGAAGLQVINPKVWMMALAVVGVFCGANADAGRYAIHALLFFLIALPCLAAWALLGAGAARLLRSATHLRRFNQAMALLLVVSALASL